MTAIDDLRWLRDNLDMLANGGLPMNARMTTNTGEYANASFIKLMSIVHNAHTQTYIAKTAQAKAQELEDAARAHAEVLTNRTEQLELEVERLRSLPVVKTCGACYYRDPTFDTCEHEDTPSGKGVVDKNAPPSWCPLREKKQ